jgi:uncharacterized membrane protein
VESRRAESFSDGVFAVAITVLVFNLLPIASPPITRHSVAGAAWGQYVAYAVSFLTIGIMWLNHHTMLAHIVRVDRTTLVLNLFALMGVVAVPFPTALVANSFGPNAGPDARQIAAVSYGLLMIAIAICYSGMWQYLAAHQDALADKPMRPPRSATLRFTAGTAGYVACVLLAAFGLPDVALIGYALLAVYYLFEHLPAPGGQSADERPPS